MNDEYLKLTLKILQSQTHSDRLNHCIDVLFDEYDIDYDLLAVTLELTVREGYLMRERTERKERRLANELAQEAARQKKIKVKKTRVALKSQNLDDVEQELIVDSLNDPLLSIALKAMNKDA